MGMGMVDDARELGVGGSNYRGGPGRTATRKVDEKEVTWAEGEEQGKQTTEP